MAFKRPPQHRIDAPILFVSPSDPAWNKARIQEELDRLADDEKDRHPWAIYVSGESRFDLDAQQKIGDVSASARDYLDGEPWIFRLRRLDWEEWPRVQADFTAAAMREQGMHEVFKMACQHGLESIDGPDAPKVTKVGKKVSAQSMQTLHEIGMHHQVDLVVEVGAAVWASSRPLGESEKKA